MVRASLKVTSAAISSVPIPVLLIATPAEPAASMTIEPTPVLMVSAASGKMPGWAMTPGWMMNEFAPTASPMFSVDRVTLAFSVIVLSPRMLLLRLATSPRSSGKPASAVQFEGAIHE